MHTFSKRLKVLICGTLILFSASLINLGYAQKESKTSIETKIALETNLESRLKKVLTEITGTEKIITIVNVELINEKKETQPKSKEDDIILPGVPLKESLAEKKVESVMMSALGDDTRTLIKKLSVTIILDKSVSAGIVEIVKKVSSGLLGIDTQRGDILDIQQMRFQKNLFSWYMLMYPPNIYWIFAVLAALLLSIAISSFLFGPFQKFAKDLVSAASTSATALKEKTAEQSGGFSASLAALPAEMAASPSNARTEKMTNGKEPLFSFVNGANLKELIFLIKNEPSKNIATVINYLSPELSSQILREVAPDRKREIISSLSKVVEFNAADIEKYESQLKSRIDFLIGGSDKITKIIDNSDEKMHTEILNELSSIDPQLAANIQKTIVHLDILASLDIAGLQLIIKQIGTYTFGQILKNFSKETQQKILSVLPTGASTRVKQEMDLGKPLNAQRLEIEKKRLTDIIRRMRDRGLI